MKFISKKFLLLGAILLIGAFLRFYSLGSVPPSPDWDEAALGYNAYSILHTGRDEYGKFLPLILRSFDDYKPGLYVYFTIPVVFLFNLSVWSVRFPSAFFGVLTILGTYLLVKELFKNDKLALASSFLLAISPWHIQFSHTAFEANTGVFLNVFSAILFLKGLKKPWLLFGSVLLSCASIYVYQSEKVFAPLFFLTLVIIFKKELFAIPKKYIVGSIILGIILLTPLTFLTFTNKAIFARAQGVSFLSDTSSILKTDAVRLINDKKNNDFIGVIYDNRRLVFLKQAIANYFAHFDVNWLFLTGDISRHHAPGMGLLYIWELPFICIGIYKLLFGSFDRKTKIFLFTWFLLAPIPASVTTGVPHAIRTINFLPVFQIFSALGIIGFFGLVNKKTNPDYIKYITYIFLFGISIFNFAYYFNQYFVQQNYYNSEDWQYGYAAAVEKVSQIESKYSKIVVSDTDYFDQSYMFFLFYLKYPPLEYQRYSRNASGGFRENHMFGKYEFRPIVWDREQKTSSILYVGKPSDFSENAKKLLQINYLDGKPAITIVEGQ